MSTIVLCPVLIHTHTLAIIMKKKIHNTLAYINSSLDPTSSDKSILNDYKIDNFMNCHPFENILSIELYIFYSYTIYKTYIIILLYSK